MFKGIIYIFFACFIWGLIFVIPNLMTGFVPLEITLGRYFFLGLFSCFVLLTKNLKNKLDIPRFVWVKALIYSLLVNILYYCSLVTGLRYANAAAITLLSALSPVTVTFYANWHHRTYSFRQLIIPVLFIILGLGCTNWEACQDLSGTASWEYTIGLLCGLVALIIWNWYMVANARFLRSHVISASVWSTLMGVCTFFWVLSIVAFLLIFQPSHPLFQHQLQDANLIYFLMGSFVLGVVCAWLGSYLWNKGCQSTPIALAGQLTIFENLFGLLFIYLIAQSFPSQIEVIGAFLIILGLAISLYFFHSQSKKDSKVTQLMHS